MKMCMSNLLPLLTVLVISIVSAEYIDDLLTSIYTRNASDPYAFAEAIRSSKFAAIANVISPAVKHSTKVNGLPLVLVHGMGDSCFNQGMKSITRETGIYMQVYSTCIPTGDSWLSDTLNGFLMDMNTNVAVFAEKVKADSKLAEGFHCIGLSQGNNICRGYIQQYNDPVVSAHLSIHGPVVGVASLPSCNPDAKAIGDLCREIDQVLGKAAYTPKVQSLLFQADYFREPNFVNTTQYQEYSQIATWNNEGLEITLDSKIKVNFGKTNRFAMIKALADTVVIPNEGEWWGAYDNNFATILSMKETAWYKDDLFGLRTADEAGKVMFNSTKGNHLEFSDEELYGWLDLYL